MSSLIVLLPAEPVGAATEFSFALSADRRTLEQHGSAPAPLLPQPRGAGAEVVAVVPVQALSWHQLELPKGVGPQSPRLRGVLEGLLEERLLDDPDQLHFAVQPQAGNGPLWVAACDKGWLRGALQVLEAAGRPATRIVPEVTPQEPGALQALGDPANPLLVWAGPEGVLALPLAPASLGLLPAPAGGAPCLAEPAVAALAEQVLQHPVKLQQVPQRLLAAAQTDWDLAQFEFTSSSHARVLKRLASGWTEFLRAPQWRAARWGAVVLVACNVIGLNAWAWKERSALEAKREQIRATLTQTFPQVKVVVDAPVQMEREVATLRQLTGVASGRDLESMLAALSMAAPPGRSVSGLEFSGTELRARGLGLTQDELRPVAANLKSLGYAATLQGDVLVIAQEGSP
jgi:general secretion pathway protein L